MNDPLTLSQSFTSELSLAPVTVCSVSLSSISIDVGVSPVRVRVKDRMVRVPPGYQAELVIQLLWVDGEPPQQITSLDINSAYGL